MVRDPATNLFGRERPLARLGDAVAGAMAGRSSFVLVTGEAGIGKTRVLRAAADAAGRAGMRTLWGTSAESGRSVPYLPLFAALRALVEDGAAEDRGVRLRRAPDDAALAVVRRALAGHPGASAVPPGLDTARFVEAVFDLLARRPTLLVVDDVHWADDSTLTVLDYLAHRAVDVPLVLLAAARDDQPAALAALAIADGRRFERLEIGRMSAEDVRRQATALLGDPIPVREAMELHHRSAGNPFFVEQLLAGAGPDGPTAPSPPSLRALILRRVAGLPPEGRQVVDAMGVVGRGVDAPRLADISGLDERATRDGLAAATAAGIIVPDELGFAFRHPLFAEVIESVLTGPDRRALHAAAARAAERVRADVAEIADHWWRAGHADRAWASAREAGMAAARSYAFAEARLHLERALATWPDTEPGRVECILEAARMAWLSGDPDRALELATDARAVAPGKVEAVVELGVYAWDAGRREEAVEAFTAARPLLAEGADPALRARATWGAGRAAVATGDPAAGAELGLDAARQALAIGDLVVASEGYALAAMSRGFQGRLDGLPWLDDAVELALRSGATFCTGHGYQFLVDLRGLEGSHDAALEAASHGIDACTRLGIARTHGSDLRGRAALLHIDRGALDEAVAVLDAADPRAFPSLATALVAMRRGGFERAERALDEAAGLGAIGGPGALGGWLELARLELAWLQSDASGARRWATAIPFVPGVWGADVGAWAARWRARLGVGNRSALLDAAAGHPDARRRAALVAEVDAAHSQPPDAARWSSAASAWDAALRPWEAAWARLDVAAAHFTARDTQAGRVALDGVVQTADALVSPPLRKHAADLARRARIRLEPVTRPTGSPDEPTEREREVLELLAEGLTNPQIAERLFLSPKTVGIHVSRLFAKLDAHTRGEAVAVARRRGMIG